jgi:hypothetical protein
MFFKKSGPDVKEMNKPVLPEKQRNMPKIRQGSPMKVKDNHLSSQTVLRQQSTATNNPDKIDDAAIDLLEIEQAL